MLQDRFEAFQALIPQLVKDILQWVKCLKDQFTAEDAFANELVDVYTMDKHQSDYTDTLALINQYKQACSKLLSGPWKEAVLLINFRKLISKSRLCLRWNTLLRGSRSLNS
jgi:hypothetical protein